MAIPFVVALNNAGPLPNIVEPITKYRAYKDGNCEVFNYRDLALKFSKLVESFVEKADEVNESRSNRNKHEQQAVQMWLYALRTDYYPDLSDYQFNCILNFVQNEQRYSYDQQVERFREIYDFVNQYNKE